MEKVLGIFTCHNRYNKTKNSLEAFLQDRDIEWSFVVAEDASTDGTREYLDGLEFVEVVPCDGNAYYSGGMRAAIDRAKSITMMQKLDYILLFNDDFMAYSGAISRLIDLQKSIDKNAIMVGSTEDSDGNYTYGGIIRKSSYRPKYEHVAPQMGIKKCDTFNANCVLIPTEVFLQLPNIDEHYIHSFGDYDYGFTATNMGYDIYNSNFYVGLCEHDHEISGSWQDKTLPIKKRIELKERPTGNPWRQWFYFLHKNYGLLTAIVYTINDMRKIIL